MRLYRFLLAALSVCLFVSLFICVCMCVCMCMCVCVRLLKLYSILLFEKINYQAPLAQLVSALAQESKHDYVRVRIPAEFFSQKQFFFFVFFIDIFLGSFILQYGNIWYQNDGDKIFYRMMRSDLEDSRFEFLVIFFIIFTYIFDHSDLDI